MQTYVEMHKHPESGRGPYLIVTLANTPYIPMVWLSELIEVTPISPSLLICSVKYVRGLVWVG